MQISLQNLNAIISLGCFPLVRSTLPLSQSSPTSTPVKHYCLGHSWFWIELETLNADSPALWQHKFSNTEYSWSDWNDGRHKIFFIYFFFKKTHLSQWWAMLFWGTFTKIKINKKIKYKKKEFMRLKSQILQLFSWKDPLPRGRVTVCARVLDWSSYYWCFQHLQALGFSWFRPSCGGYIAYPQHPLL